MLQGMTPPSIQGTPRHGDPDRGLDGSPADGSPANSSARGPRGWPATIAIWTLALVTGAVLPFVLYFLVVGFPYCLAMVCGMASILGLPDPLGLVVWYLVLGAIGGIGGDMDWGLWYGLGLLVAVLAQPVGFVVLPWALLLVLAWVVVRVGVEWVRRGEPG